MMFPTVRASLMTVVAGFVCAALNVSAQGQVQNFTPVTDAVLQDPDPEDWLSWRRTLDGWGYSPLDQVNRDNVGSLRLVWTRPLRPGGQEGTPLAYGGALYFPNPNDILQAIDAVTGDLIWEYRRDLPDDLGDYLIASLMDTNRNLAVWNNLIIDTSTDDYVFALDATTGELVRNPNERLLLQALFLDLPRAGG